MAKTKIVVGVLTHNRPRLLKETLESFNYYLKEYEKLIEFIVFDNGSKKEVIEHNKLLCQSYNAKFISCNEVIDLPKGSKSRDHNISIGHRKLSLLMKKYDGDAYMILEDDWKCIAQVPLDELVKYLRQHPEVGQIRLRDCKYDGTLKGCAKHNFVTQEPIRWSKEEILGEYTLSYGNLHWVNNPSLITREALEFVNQGFDSEVACMEAFHKIFPINLQLKPGIFKHSGPWRHREDLVDQGFIKVGNHNG